MLTRICSRASRQIHLLAAAIVFFGALPSADAQGFQWARKVVSNANEEAFGVATGPGGVYVVGYTVGSLGGQTNAGNRDAVVVKFSPAGNELWIRQFGTASADTLQAVTTDASGVYVAGSTGGALSGSSLGSTDAFVRKYDPNGNELWTRQFGTASTDEALGIASDGTGVYVVGKTQGTFAGQPTSANGDPFVRKYDANGNELWTRQFGTASTEDATGVAADTSGVYITGRTNGPLATSQGGVDAFLRKYDAGGTAVWTRQFGTAQTEAAYAVAVNASGVYVGGGNIGRIPWPDQGQQRNL